MFKKRASTIASLSSEEIAALNLLKKRLDEELHIDKVILFGSKAREDYTADSDVDIMVIVNEADYRHVRKQVSQIQYEILLQIDAPLMVKVETSENWNSGNTWPPLKFNIEQEGIELEL